MWYLNTCIWYTMIKLGQLSYPSTLSFGKPRICCWFMLGPLNPCFHFTPSQFLNYPNKEKQKYIGPAGRFQPYLVWNNFWGVSLELKPSLITSLLSFIWMVVSLWWSYGHVTSWRETRLPGFEFLYSFGSFCLVLFLFPFVLFIAIHYLLLLFWNLESISLITVLFFLYCFYFKCQCLYLKGILEAESLCAQLKHAVL